MIMAMEVFWAMDVDGDELEIVQGRDFLLLRIHSEYDGTFSGFILDKETIMAMAAFMTEAASAFSTTGKTQ